MCVFKNHAFIYFLQPPSRSGTIFTVVTDYICTYLRVHEPIVESELDSVNFDMFVKILYTFKPTHYCTDVLFADFRELDYTQISVKILRSNAPHAVYTVVIVLLY